ncbi:hypothetical protein [Shinella zoogloeoides]
MTLRTTGSSPSSPVRRGAMPARWCASNLILMMLVAMIAIVSIIEFLRG